MAGGEFAVKNYVNATVLRRFDYGLALAKDMDVADEPDNVRSTTHGHVRHNSDFQNNILYTLQLDSVVDMLSGYVDANILIIKRKIEMFRLTCEYLGGMNAV
jgi:hypothetical protein